MITFDQLKEAYQETIDSFEEGEAYSLNPDVLAQYNAERKKLGYSVIADKAWKVRKENGELKFSGDYGKYWSVVTKVKVDSTFAFAFTFTFSCVAFALCSKNNWIKVNEGFGCNGKVVEIEGKKYKLVLQ
jgi:hypothetical protein